MSYAATVFHVLIASPSDVPGERDAIAQSLHNWNALNSQATKTVLLPVMWESHTAPAMGDRPQEIINNQIVRSCDMLIGAFWSRLGSHTGVEESGTVEEIKWFLKQKKPVMLYFSTAPIPFDSIDTKQLDRLKAFRNEIRGKGLQEGYDSVHDLKEKLSRQLTIVMRGTSVEAVVDVSAVKRANASSSTVGHSAPQAEDSEQISLEDYSDKSFTVFGPTTAFKDQLKEIGGKWIRTRDGRKGWNFSKRRLDEVATILGVKPVLSGRE